VITPSDTTKAQMSINGQIQAECKGTLTHSRTASSEAACISARCCPVNCCSSVTVLMSFISPRCRAFKVMKKLSQMKW